MLFKDEVIDVEDLANKLIDYDYLKKIKVAVICFIFTKDGKIILNKRGLGARDEVGKIQAIGGSVNKTDVDFIAAMKREIKEELGNVTVKIGDFIGAYYDRKTDNETKEEIDWIILGYIGYLESGKLENKEKDRCMSIIIDDINNIKSEKLSKSTYEFIEVIKRIK